MAEKVTPATISTTGTGADSLDSVTDSGKTVIAPEVIGKIVGLAARDIPGVYALGGGAARAFGAIRGAVGATDHAQGVNVEVGEKQVAVDLTLVVEYPVALQDVADQVRDAVYRAIHNLVGMEVSEVNISINDVHIPSDDDNAEAEESRVQ